MVVGVLGEVGVIAVQLAVADIEAEEGNVTTLNPGTEVLIAPVAMLNMKFATRKAVRKSRK